MTRARDQLVEITTIANRLLDDWHRFVETSEDLAHASDRLGVHGGDTPDPTIAGVYANTTISEAESSIAEALGVLKQAEKMVTGVTREHPETARHVDAAKRAARCADPVCDDNAVKDGYCFRHWAASRAS